MRGEEESKGREKEEKKRSKGGNKRGSNRKNPCESFSSAQSSLFGPIRNTLL